MFCSLRGIDLAPVSEIRAIPGIGPAKAAQVKAALEIGKRLCREEAVTPPGPPDPQWALRYVTAYYGPYLRDTSVESSCIILLNRGCLPIRALELGRGSVDGVRADPTLIVREALRSAASYVILVHNHPSGSGEPSEQDAALTIAARDACALFGIRLLDHIVIGRDWSDCRSMALEGFLRTDPNAASVRSRKAPSARG
jgi:DNA repair protein RadC